MFCVSALVYVDSCCLFNILALSFGSVCSLPISVRCATPDRLYAVPDSSAGLVFLIWVPNFNAIVYKLRLQTASRIVVQPYVVVILSLCIALCH